MLSNDYRTLRGRNILSMAAPPKADSPSANASAAASDVDWLFLVGLSLFTVTVVGYTMIGGFLAAVWTDLFQSIVMWIGVVLLLTR